LPVKQLRIPDKIKKFIDHSTSIKDLCLKTKHAYEAKNNGSPLVSIVIPAFNEENSIVQSLASLSHNKTTHTFEIIVVNNNSTDRTGELVVACGVQCISEPEQGITKARNTGLKNAKGVYILNADADTIYPESWIELMTNPLIKDSKVALTYGKFSLIPVGNTGRGVYFFYEYISDLSRYINKYFKDEAVNVYGFNSGFRRSQGVEVDGFNHPEGTNEDGWLAIKLRNNGFGALHLVTDNRAMVWTTDRRIQMDGGLFKATIKRVKRILN